MINWSTSPPPAANGHALRIIRVPAAKPVRLLLTNDELCGCPTHFFGNRTHPCTGDDCKACTEGLPWKWHGYIGCKVSGSGEHTLLELTATAAQPLFDHYATAGTLRGALIECSRPSNRANGRIWIRVLPPLIDPPALPTAPDIPKILAVIWGLSTKAVDTHGTQKTQARLRVNGQAHAAANAAADPQRGQQ